MTKDSILMHDFLCLLEEYTTKCRSDHPFFSDLAPNTIKNYKNGSKNLKDSVVRFFASNDSVRASSAFTPAFAQAIVNDIIDVKGPGSAKAAVASLGSVFSFKLLYTDLGQETYNPFDYVKVPDSKSIEPWTEGEINEHLKLGDEYIKMLVCTLLNTAQRLSDITNMSVGQFVGPFDAPLVFIQKKTGKRVSIHKTKELQEAARVLFGGIPPDVNRNVWKYLLGTQAPTTEDVLRYQYMSRCVKFGIAPKRLHGLRKNAVIRLISAGATEFEIMAITGHQSTSSLRHYTTGYNTDAAGAEAIRKLEAHTHGK